MVLVLPFS
eukprot:Gb_05530 [translate_table: standard]